LGKKLSKSPNLSGDLGGSIHILHPAKRCVYTVAPKRRETLNFHPSRDELRVRGLGFWWTFPHNVKSQFS
jgi:hypothetical protein